MGLLRLLLALGVVRDHRAFFDAFFLVKGGVAVIFFYVISGFYMTLVIRENYSKLGQGWQKTFLWNRALRLFPAYWAVLLFSIVAMALWSTPTIYTAQLGMTGVERALTILANTCIIGLDVLVSGASLHWHTGPGGIVPSWQVFPVFVGWTVAVELTFYVCAAFFIVMNRRVALFAIALGLYFRVWFALINGKDLGISQNGIGYSNTPWGYHFFGVDLIFFMLGYIGYEMYVWLNDHLKRNPGFIKSLRWAATVLVAILIIEAWAFHGWEQIADYNDRQIWAALPFFTALVPVLFILTKRSAWDNFIGQYSYPIYLCHVIATDAATKFFGLPANNQFTTLASIAVAGSLLVFGIDIPIDNFRHRLTQRSKARATEGLPVRLTWADAVAVMSEWRWFAWTRALWAHGRTHSAQTSAVIAAVLMFPYCFGAGGDASRYFAQSPHANIAAAQSMLHLPLVASLGAVAWIPDAAWHIQPWLELALIAGCFFCFARIAQRLFHSHQWALFATVVTLLAWQIRFPHDPVAGTQPFYLWCAFLTLAALMCVLEAPSRASMIAAAACSAVACAATPIAWIAVPVAAWLAGRRNALAAGAGAAVGALFAVMTGSGMSAPASLRTALADVGLTLVAAIPSSYRLFLPIDGTPALWHTSPGGFKYVDDRFVHIPALNLYGWALILVAAAITWFVTARSTSQRPPLRNALSIGAALCVATGAAVAFTWSPYHAPLALGQAPDSVVLAYFGVGLLLAALVAAASRLEMPSVRAVLPAAVTCAVLIVAYGNARADRLNFERFGVVDESRAEIERAASAGFFDELPPQIRSLSIDSVTLQHLGGPVTAEALFRHYLHGRIAYDPAAEWQLNVPGNDVLVAVARRTGDGRVDRALGFTVFPQAVAREVSYHSGVETNARALKDGWLLENRHACGAVAAQYQFADASPHIVYGDGFYGAGPSGYEPLGQRSMLGGTTFVPAWYPKVYMDERASATIVPNGCAHVPVRVVLNTVAAGPGTLTITGAGQTKKIAVAASLVRVSLKLPGDRSSTVQFETDAPESPMVPIPYRYEHDRPRHTRLMIEPESLKQ